ncbi:MAG: hypothetical protein FJ284_15530 [Planctomycetes bacterium]|nr:hypothetical protein [Planctomycetota bacterium]
MSLRDCMTAQGLAEFVKPGLQALGVRSSLVSVGRPSRPIESIDLDAALARSHGQAPRWDYGVGIQQGSDCHLAWIEVHPASSSDVDSILAKLAWLKAFLGSPACQGSRSFHWIATGRVNIDQQRMRRLNSAGLRSPQKKLVLKESR